MNGKSRSNSALLVMARLPRPGRVKSRLADTIGEEKAAEFYQRCAERLFEESRRLPNGVARYIFYADAADAAAMRSWAGDDFLYEPQTRGHLGDRLVDAFTTAFGQGVQKAVVVGSDVPDLTARRIAAALRLLDHYPIVIGPDHGGGYYLMGMRMLHRDLFLRSLAWGTHYVLGHTLRIMRDLALTPAFLPTLIDIDTGGDLRRWLQSRPAGEADELVQLARQISSSE